MEEKEIRVKTGKKLPPEEKRFQPGKTGNPNGRPKGTRNRSTLFKEWLEFQHKTKNPLTKENQTLDVQDHLVLAQIAKALSGDTNAFNTLIDGAYGKLKESMEIKQDLNQKTQLDPEDRLKIIEKLKSELDDK